MFLLNLIAVKGNLLDFMVQIQVVLIYPQKSKIFSQNKSMSYYVWQQELRPLEES